MNQHMRGNARRILRLLLVMLALLVSGGSLAQVGAAPHAPQAVAPTYTIFATREGLVGRETANGHIIQPSDRFVALPSPSVLCSYQGHEYQVRITYKGRSVVVPVWDVGPWNIEDDYWSANRKYSDLPIGVPMAQAAYLEGYNGGKDEFGRRIALPNGIDIADGTFLEDLDMNKDDWVQVSFLWLGSDPGPGNAANVLPPPTAGQQPVPALPQTANPAPAPAPPANQPAVVQDPYNLVGPPLDNPRMVANAIAVDNDDPNYQRADGEWYTANCGLKGSHNWTFSTTDAAQSRHHVIWRPPLPSGPRFYEVQAYIPPCGYTSATRSARYRITYNGEVSEVTVDQEANAGRWVPLGRYDFGGDGARLIELSNLTGDNEQAVRFDTIAWIPSDDTTPPTSRMLGVRYENRGWRIQWRGEDDLSGVASYDVQVKQLPDGGWRDWVRAGEGTEAWFGPDEGKDFAFRCRARDASGNEEAWPEGAEVDTSSTRP